MLSCDDGTSIPLGGDNSQGTGIVKDFTSVSGGFLESSAGYMIEVKPGCVPRASNDSIATVTFSIEENVPLADLPVAVPSKYTIVSGVVSFGPNGFTFAMPVTVWFPAKNETSPDGLYVIHYDEEAGEWVEVPISGTIDSTKQIGVSSFTLGYFALVRRTTQSFFSKSNNQTLDSKSEGGLKFGDIIGGTGPNLRYGAWYILTIKSMTFKYPEQASMYQNRAGVNTLLCQSATTCSDPTSTFPRHPTKFRLPQGTYEIWVTAFSYSVAAQYRSSFYTYSIPITVTINGPITYWGWGNEDEGSWTSPGPLPSGGTWVESPSQPTFAGTSTCWPNFTIPYGTGYFKATLKWVNSTSNITDYDLHVFGPVINGYRIHVFYNSKTVSDGSIELDRDWIDAVGNAIENIYSLKALPKGKYDIKVCLYRIWSGTPPPFSVDVKRGAYFKTYRKQLAVAKDTAFIESFTIQ